MIALGASAMGTASPSVEELAGAGSGTLGLVSRFVEETGALVCARKGIDAKIKAARRRCRDMSLGIYFNS